MTREQRKAIDEMIDAFEANAIGEVGTLADMTRLARLGASIAAPRDDEIEAMARGHLRSQRIGPEKPLTWADLGGPCQRECKIHMSAALSALRESKP